MPKAIVIGAGFGGLCSAAFLARDGYDVTVLEKNEGTGGRARMFKDQGFSFDMGPSWYLMPDVFEAFFAQFGKKPEQYYTLERLDPSYRLFFGGKDYIDMPANIQEAYALFDTLEKDGAKKLKRYLAEAEYKYRVALDSFLYKEYRNIADFFTWRMISEGWKLNVFQQLSKYADKFFESERAKKIVQYSIVFLGGTPENTPALYSLISHVDMNLGVWYPKGGMNAVALGIEKLGKELGVTFKYNTPVEKILVDNGKVSGVQTKEGTISADLIIANADYPYVETQLLDEEHQSYKQKYWDKVVVAPSGYILYLGIDKKIENLSHHNLFLDNDWTRHFSQIFNKPGWPEHPSYYVCCPSKTDPDIAPQGKENLFLLMPVASDLQDSDAVREKYFESLTTHLENITQTKFRDKIVSSRIYTHRDFKEDYHAFKGTALGLAHTLFQTANFRPHQRSKKVKDLYYVGHFTHPGIGVPMTLIGAQVICNAINKK